MMKNMLGPRALLVLSLALCACQEPGGTATPVMVETAAWGGGDGDGTWRYHPLPGAEGPDLSVEVELRVDEAARSSLPVHQIDRYADYNNNEDLGGYEAAVALRRGPAGQYRFMLSVLWGEVVLWSSEGGLLAVRPAPLALGRVHRVRASALGPCLRLWLDGALLIDVWDDGLPQGGAALGRMDGRTWFGAAKVTQTPVATRAVPRPLHQPRFALRSWKGIPWAFDGDEPVFALGVPPEVAAAFWPLRYDAMAFEVKLGPRERPRAYLPLYMQNFGAEPFALGALTRLERLAEGDRLVLVLDTEESEGHGGLRGRTTVTLSYDAGADSYRYDVHGELVVPPGGRLRTEHPIDITDPGFYNGVPSATPGRSWPVTLTHAVYQQEQGALYRVPLNHVGHYPGYGSNRWHQERMGYLKPDGGFYAYVGDPRRNPVLELDEPAARREFDVGPCGLGFDIHLRWVPGGEPGAVLGPGRYGVRWRLRAAGPQEAAAWLARAGYAAPGDLSATWLLYTGGVGHLERFDKVVPQASPFGEYPWGPGSLQDPVGGRGGGGALRLAGPLLAESSAGSERFTEPLEGAAGYEVSVWVRTEDVRGEGPGIVFGDQAYYPGITGTTPWRRIGFVARPGGSLSLVPFALHNSGAGRVWFDDFLIRPLSPERPADPAIDHPPKPLGGGMADLHLWWSAESDASDGARTVLDRSGHGHHATLENGAAWVTEDGGRAIRLDGQGSHVLMRGHPSAGFPEEASLGMWLKLARQPAAWAIVASGGRLPNERWRAVLVSGEDGLRIDLQLPGGRLISGAPVVPTGRWTYLVLAHNGSELRAYRDGELVVAGPVPGSWLGRGADSSLRVGAGSLEGLAYSGVLGHLGSVKVFPRVLTAPEVAAEQTRGPF